MAQQAEYTYDLFISYADADQSWVYGYLMPALDLPPERVMTRSAFTPGAPVVTEFERAVTTSRYTVLVLSPAYLADEWSIFGELLTSHASVTEKRARLVPLLLRPCTLPLRVDLRVRLDCTDSANWESAIARLRRLLDRREPPTEPVACPYPGMRAFAEADSEVFCGRADEIEELLRRLRRHPFVTVIGPSGSGKSSLVFAGLLPRLRKSHLFEGSEWRSFSMRPGEKPLTQLRSLLLEEESQCEGSNVLLIVDQFEETFTLADEQAVPFQEALLDLSQRPGIFVLLTVRADFYPDLMESPLWGQVQGHRLEVLPLDADDLRQAIVSPAANVGVFIEPALIERLVADAVGEPGILPFLQETLVLIWGKLVRHYLPLRAYTSLVSSEGAVPRTGLQVAMAEHAEHTLAELLTISPQAEATARRIFLRLIHFGEGRADIRRRQPLSSLRAVSDDPNLFGGTLKHLTRNRLLTLSGEEGEPNRQVDIAHEKLIDGWPTLRGWVDERGEAEQVRRGLEDKATEWIERGKGGGGLLDRMELVDAERWLSGPDAADLGHSKALLELVTASRAEQKRKRLLWVGAIGTIGLLVLGVLVAILVGQTLLSQQRKVAAETEEAVATARVTLTAQAIDARKTIEAERTRAQDLASDLLVGQLVLESEALLDDRYDRSLLLSIEAFRLADTVETRDNLLRVLRAEPEVVRYIRDSDGPRAIAFSPDGETLVALTGGGIRIWDAKTGKALETVSTEIDGSTVVSRDGRTGYSAERGDIRLWNLVSGEAHDLLTNHQTFGRGELLSPDNRIRASWSGDHSVRLEDPMTGLTFGWLEGWFDEEPVMAFSPDSQLLATAAYVSPFRGEDMPSLSVIVWRFEAESYDDEEYEFCIEKAWPSHYDGERCISGRGEAGWAFFGDENRDLVGSVTDMTFSPDGQYLAVTVQESTDVVYLLDVGDESLHTLWKRETSVTNLALTSLTSSCGGFVAVGREDGKIIFQAVDEGVNTSREPLTHPGPVEALAFSADCRRLASMGGGVIVLWDLTAVDVPLPFELQIDTRPGDFASFTAWDYSGAVPGSECIRTDSQLDPDSHCVQSAIEGGFAGFTGIVTSLAKSPDGRTLAAGIFDEFDQGEQPWPEECYRGEVWLWPGGPKSALYLGYQECVVTDLVFSPDSEVLASVDQDGAVVFWDVDFESLIARACYKANRNLTEDEWHSSMGPDRPYRVTCPSLEGPDPSRLEAALKQIEPLLPTPAPTATPRPTRTPTPTAAPRVPSGGEG